MDNRDYREPEAEQRIAGIDESEVTVEYTSEARDEFREGLESVFRNLALSLYQDRDSTGEAALEAGLDCFRRYFQVMKGQTNLTEDDVTAALQEEANRQQRFYAGLERLKQDMQVHGVTMELLRPEGVYCEPAWDCGPTTGTTLRLNSGAWLVAVPPVSMRTQSYMAFLEEPVAANVIAITGDYILLLPVRQDTGEKFSSACASLFGTEKEITSEFNDVWLAKLGSGYLLLDTEKSYTASEIEDLRNRYDVPGVIEANSLNFTAMLHLPEVSSLSKLSAEIYGTR